jgi:aryl-alcohol dehydrogenase-like predicted oxidoreductase
LAVTPYSALASGFLTGKYRRAADATGVARSGAVGDYLNEKGFAVAGQVESVVAVERCSASPVSRRWASPRPPSP